MGVMGKRSSQELKCQSNEFLLPWEETGGFSFSLFDFFQEKKNVAKYYSRRKVRA